MEKIHEKVSVHINDTHPAVAPAEFMRLLVDEYRLEWDVAWDVTTKTMSYTNHSILAEALEKWDAELFKKVLPRVYQIILEIDNRFVSDMASSGVAPQIIENTRIVKDGLIHMANLAIIGGYSVNGVAKLHTELLKEDTLRDFYNLYPEKFNNKTKVSFNVVGHKSQINHFLKPLTNGLAVAGEVISMNCVRLMTLLTIQKF